jgi:hypothetical protein
MYYSSSRDFKLDSESEAQELELEGTDALLCINKSKHIGPNIITHSLLKISELDVTASL